MTLSGKTSSTNSSRSGFRRYVIFSMSTSTGIVLLTIILGETNVIHAGYGKEMIIMKQYLSSKLFRNFYV
jgi:hypothetical protein